MGNAKSPVLDWMSAGMPLIGPRKHEHSGQSEQSGFPHLLEEKSGLVHLPVSKSIHTQLTQEERFFRLPSSEVEGDNGKRFQVVEIDVESKKV